MTRQPLHDQPWGPGRRPVRAGVAALPATLAGLALALPAGAREPAAGWYCTTDVATAYRFDPARDRWKTLILPVAGQSFVVRPGAGGPWELVWQGGDGTVLDCAGDFDAADELRCGGEQLFTLNRGTLTFSSRAFGPANGNLGEDLTAATITGRCTPLPQ
jgi:hypothetical protein